MTGTGLLLILIGFFVIINAPNFVGVIEGHITLGQTKTSAAPVPASPSGPTITNTNPVA